MPRQRRVKKPHSVDFRMKFPDGTGKRVRARHSCATVRELKERIEGMRIKELEEWRQRKAGFDPDRKCPTLAEWFDGGFWKGWVEARGNGESEREAKRSMWRLHIAPELGHLTLNQVNQRGALDDFKAGLMKKPRLKGSAKKLSPKAVKNVLAVLASMLNYAEERGEIQRAVKVGLPRVPEPDIAFFTVEEYQRLLRAAVTEGEPWIVAVTVAGECGLRIGEVRALKWERIDLVSELLVVQGTAGKKREGTTKGKAVRRVPLTDAALVALKSLSVVRTGYVLRYSDGGRPTDSQVAKVMYRMLRKARLPLLGDEGGKLAWHRLRHTYATHAAALGANPFTLMQWMGHRDLKTTMRYVGLARAHRGLMPSNVLRALEGISDPDQRVLAGMSARSRSPLGHREEPQEETSR